MEVLRLTQKIQELHEDENASVEDVTDYVGELIVKLIELEECETHGSVSTEELTLRIGLEGGSWTVSIDGLCCAEMNEQAEEVSEGALERLLPQG